MMTPGTLLWSGLPSCADAVAARRRTSSSVVRLMGAVRRASGSGHEFQNNGADLAGLAERRLVVGAGAAAVGPDLQPLLGELTHRPGHLAAADVLAAGRQLHGPVLAEDRSDGPGLGRQGFLGADRLDRAPPAHGEHQLPL